ncbi:Beta-tubulin cofactor d protein [Rutstroemia sp. NJR-2017a WRK4]|nr:Beta-tubulin cofactor d protein [Rutstroemia sp. NJR-2017a WRK4]
MDAPELEEDVRVQRDSGQLLADFEESLNPFLYNTAAHNAPIRRRVRISETERLVSLLENFQELPQLLDPYLPRFVPTLADALLTSISRQTSKLPSTNADLLMPLPKAICRLLYTFCKVRGEKVIVRFLSTEVRHVDLLLFAVEKGTEPNDNEAWSWEQKYVVLVWLSQLLLAPFDLVSMSADAMVDDTQTRIAGLELSPEVPAVAIRAISISLRFLAASGKERDAAKGLLVRVAIRRDVQDLNVLDNLIKWALSTLRGYEKGQSIYRYLGILSFLAGITKTSLNTSYMDQYLPSVFAGVRSLIASADTGTSELYDSAVTRELCIKVLRNITLLALRNPDDDFVGEIVDDSIQYLFDCSGDGSTPVRLAASKALSRITLKLDAPMGEEIVSMIIERLDHDIIWPKLNPPDQRHDMRFSRANLDRVKPQEWHGLIMTLSQLLYHRSPPPSTLRDILVYLFIGLSFEQRDMLGSPIGANVRDAACFGLWAVARKYSTTELEAVSLECLVDDVEIKSTTVQTLATQLVVAACLDPVGNIRRGSSAALQELIGRHPNTVTKGIDPEGKDLITIVGYHAVALRSKAITEVACGVAELSVQDYAHSIMAALLSWRGVGDKNERTRQLAAEAMGRVALMSAPKEQPQVWRLMASIIEKVHKNMLGLQIHQSNERHGLVHCVAALVSEMPGFQDNSQAAIHKAMAERGAYSIFEKILLLVNQIIDAKRSAHFLEQDHARIVEATATLILHTFRTFCFSGLLPWLVRFPTADMLPRFLKLESTSQLLEAAYKNNCFTEHQVGLLGCANNVAQLKTGPLPEFLSKARRYFEDSLEDGLIEDADLIRNCVRVIMVFSDKGDREAMALRWISSITVHQGRHSSWKDKKRGIVVAIWAVFSQEKHLQSRINESMHERWRSTVRSNSGLSYDLDTRIALLQYLAESDVLDTHAHEFEDMVAEGLDDYHLDPVRGDISSLVRIAAAKAAERMWDESRSGSNGSHGVSDMALGDSNGSKIRTSMVVEKVLRLCVERLDNVRAEGRKAITPLLRPSPETSVFLEASVTSYSYFYHVLNTGTDGLLNLGPESTWNYSIMLAGYVTSAANGAQDVIRNSRAALLDYCEADPANTDRVTKALFDLLIEFLKKDDRVLIATLEIIAFLFDMQVMQTSKSVDFSKLYLQIQHSHHRSTNVKKIEAAIRCYGGLCEVLTKPPRKLFKMLMHPYPNMRKVAADELYGLGGVVEKTNWTKARNGDEDRVWEGLERDGGWEKLVVGGRGG